MSLLEVKGLRRDYGPLRAVDDVSFSLEAGSGERPLGLARPEEDLHPAAAHRQHIPGVERRGEDEPLSPHLRAAFTPKVDGRDGAILVHLQHHMEIRDLRVLNLHRCLSARPHNDALGLRHGFRRGAIRPGDPKRQAVVLRRRHEDFPSSLPP
ncbi:ABC transporter ATP-binding protein [Corallococcus macrosporus]|uniref:ABC transporter ATP-binding protein n=1 Tax=Myxococcus fulvus (strain ATCC BAA-855 / HW-1) TaxID=483219 RepID=F8CRS6_MYXFH|nr:ABC transporter ATP-binding protein [Corallococcus macrosporus]